ncbi:SSI family serine proteinase inhibitor [Streptomyces sp. DT24]|uniref:SSI family serine proteinase inhibitor n=1 Tax=unclassified Streptomyces TaxID=2593676 RepID=UPI0023B9C340|nr:SSI family serine proteinase inhibitor [Streptomyces sp. AM 4-1-1]WEH34457.1 SSI family serine proteinase inhibitor [Streptomyces sp. AM 4-1-1]
MPSRLALIAVASVAALSVTPSVAVAASPLPSSLPATAPVSAAPVSAAFGVPAHASASAHAVSLMSAAPARPSLFPIPIPVPAPRPAPHTSQPQWPQAPQRAKTRLTVTIANSGDPAANGTFVLECEPVGGTHPDPKGACARLAKAADLGDDPFMPVPQDLMCTLQYGGPATAKVSGTWRGREFEASFERSDGCEIGRWNNLRPLLPDVR